MRRLATVFIPLTFVLSANVASASSPEGTLAIEVCGRLVDHAPATDTANGRVTIGTRTYAVAAGTVTGNGGVTVAPGRDLCFEGSAGRTTGELLRYLFFPIPAGTICGTALANIGTTVNLRADFGLLRAARGPGVREPTPGERVCYVAAVSPEGDLLASREDPVDTTLEREWVWNCGSVKAYRPATSTADGAITVGSETFAIARSTSYTGDPAGDRTDRTTPGQSMCVRGVRGPDLELIEYLTTAMAPNVGGQASEYVPPTDGNAGLATLSFRSQLRLRIPAAIDRAADIARKPYCYSVGLDAAGDMSAVALIPCGAGGVAGPQPSPMATVTPPAVPGPSSEPTPTAVSFATATPSSPAAPADVGPLAIGALAALTAAAVAFVVWRSRAGGRQAR